MPTPDFQNSLCIQLMCGFGDKMTLSGLSGVPTDQAMISVEEYVGRTPTCSVENVTAALDELCSHGLTVKLPGGDYMLTQAGSQLARQVSY